VRAERLFLECVAQPQAASRISLWLANELTSAQASSDVLVVVEAQRRRAVSNAEMYLAAKMAPAAAMLFEVIRQRINGVSILQSSA
jgi:hypothetical protein